MSIKELSEINQANESVSKYKLLSAYGGPGSIVHTQYGSIIISCIEEWGFLKRVLEIHKEAIDDSENNTDEKVFKYVYKQARLEKNGSIGISNDKRLFESIIDRKKLINLKYLSLIPDIEIKDFGNKVENIEFTIPSTFMPKIFADKLNVFKSYGEWFNDWVLNNKEKDPYGNKFFPPKKTWKELLTQDNIVLICEHGHISDFPWSQFLWWRKEDPMAIHNDETVNLFEKNPCCGTKESPTSKIKITSSTANASGFDGKWLKCDNCKKSVSLQGLMGVKIKCPGHSPMEVKTGDSQYYSGDKLIRQQTPPSEICKAKNSLGKDKPMSVALTTGNNLYYSRILSSIFMPDELFKDELEIEKDKLEKRINRHKKNWEEAIDSGDKEDEIYNEKKWIELVAELKTIAQNIEPKPELTDSEKEIKFRNQEYKVFSFQSDLDINKEEKDLKVKDVTENLDLELRKFFSRILRIDNMKITSAQLDFSRVVPADADAEDITSKNIFRSKPEDVNVYPVVENFGEGIFIGFDEKVIDEFASSEAGINLINSLKRKLSDLKKDSNPFNKGAIDYGNLVNWQLYLVHTFSHLIMREMEFRCGYPTASLSERIYVSNDEKYRMYGCMIYTAEGAEGSMGGLIAQTRLNNLNKLIKSALKRATICHSDPLCWESDGQGLFDLNFSSCFSCSLVSETSCEHRNVYLDRRILVDDDGGFFKEVI